MAGIIMRGLRAEWHSSGGGTGLPAGGPWRGPLARGADVSGLEAPLDGIIGGTRNATQFSPGSRKPWWTPKSEPFKGNGAGDRLTLAAARRAEI